MENGKMNPELAEITDLLLVEHLTEQWMIPWMFFLSTVSKSFLMIGA